MFLTTHRQLSLDRFASPLGWLLIAVVGWLCLPPQAFWRSICAAPWLEEAVLRWGLQEPLQASLGSARQWQAPLVTALCFALLHILLSAGDVDLVRAAGTLFPAWWVGHVYQRRRQLAVCVAWHAAFNLLWLTALNRSAPLTRWAEGAWSFFPSSST